MSSSLRGEAFSDDNDRQVRDLQSRHRVDQAIIRLAERENEAARDKIGHLETALASSRRIGAAIGIVMALYRVPYDEAFDLLRTASQHTHKKLRDLADEVVLTGAIPTS